jgi:spore germination protein GerM
MSNWDNGNGGGSSGGGGGGGGRDRHEELLRRSLHREAEQVTPRGDGLAKIRARTSSARRGIGWLRIALVTSAAAVMAVAVISVLSGDDTVRFEPSGGPSGVPSPGSTDSPRTGTTTATKVYIYYLGQTEQGIKLYREYRTVGIEDGGVVKGALNAMFSERPLDPGYRSLWPRGTRVRGISRDGDTLTVDLSREALYGAADTEEAELSVQQLVYTVTANYPSAKRVRLWIDGTQVSGLWGCDTAVGQQPMRRAPQADVQAPVWIIDPAEDAVVGRTVDFDGVASVFEAHVDWEVRRDGQVVDHGFATATTGAPGFGTWRDSVTLSPGAYELRAFESSPEDGRPAFVDTKTFTVGS